MATSPIQSRSIIYTASGLGIAMSLSAIIWRAYYADLVRNRVIEDWKENKFLVGAVAFLITTLVIHIIWLVSSVVLMIWGQKGLQPVMYWWMIVTWSSIILDTAFFGYTAYNYISGHFSLYLPLDKVKEKDVNMAMKGINHIILLPSVALLYMALLLIHIILVYLTIQVGYYATHCTRKVNKGHIMGRKEVDAYLEDEIPHVRQPILGIRAYQNGVFSRSVDDLRFATGGYGDKISSGYKRYTGPDDIPVDYRRASRYNVESARY